MKIKMNTKITEDALAQIDEAIMVCECIIDGTSLEEIQEGYLYQRNGLIQAKKILEKTINHEL